MIVVPLVDDTTCDRGYYWKITSILVAAGFLRRKYNTASGQQYLPDRVIGRTSWELDAAEEVFEFFEHHAVGGEQVPSKGLLSRRLIISLLLS